MSTLSPPVSSGKHTPGPWKANERKGITANLETQIGVGTDYPETLCSGSRSIATMTGSYFTRSGQPNREKHIETNRANARLIAAAPDLLEACRAVIAYGTKGKLPDGRWPRDIAQAAIAKVEG